MPEEHLAAKVIGLQVKIEGCICIFIWKFCSQSGHGTLLHGCLQVKGRYI